MTDFIDGGRQYRRGVILGLSLAELFTILVFLLLLVLGAYTLVQEQTLQDKTALADAQRDVLVRVMGDDKVNPIEPALPGDLRPDGSGIEEPHVEDSSESNDGLVQAEDKPPRASEASDGTAAAKDEPPPASRAGSGPVLGESPPASQPEARPAVETVSRQQRAIDGMTRRLAEHERLIEMLRDASGDSPTTAELQDKLAALETDKATCPSLRLRRGGTTVGRQLRAMAARGEAVVTGRDIGIEASGSAVC